MDDSVRMRINNLREYLSTGRDQAARRIGSLTEAPAEAAAAQPNLREMLNRLREEHLKNNPGFVVGEPGSVSTQHGLPPSLKGNTQQLT